MLAHALPRWRPRSHPFPEGLKPGDFIRFEGNFANVMFEVKSCSPPDSRGSLGFWMLTYHRYAKYDAKPDLVWINSTTLIKQVLPAEMAVPVMLHQRVAFHASFGHFDPIYGFAPLGTALRTRADAA